MLARCARKRLPGMQSTSPAPPRRPRPRKDQAGAVSVHSKVYFLGYPKVVCEDVFPPGSTLLRLRGAGAWGQGFLGPQVHLNLQQPAPLPLALQFLPDVH